MVGRILEYEKLHYTDLALINNCLLQIVTTVTNLLLDKIKCHHHQVLVSSKHIVDGDNFFKFALLIISQFGPTFKVALNYLGH